MAESANVGGPIVAPKRLKIDMRIYVCEIFKKHLMKNRKQYVYEGHEPVYQSRVNIEAFEQWLLKRFPNETECITATIDELDVYLCETYCQYFAVDEEGHFQDPDAVCRTLAYFRLDLDESSSKVRMHLIQDKNINEAKHRALSCAASKSPQPPTMSPSSPVEIPVTTSGSLIKNKNVCSTVGALGKWSLVESVSTVSVPQPRTPVSVLEEQTPDHSLHELVCQGPTHESQPAAAVDDIQSPRHTFSLQSPPSIGGINAAARKRNDAAQSPSSQAEAPDRIFLPSDGSIEEFETITFFHPWRNTSLEELRLLDYRNGLRYEGDVSHKLRDHDTQEQQGSEAFRQTPPTTAPTAPFIFQTPGSSLSELDKSAKSTYPFSFDFQNPAKQRLALSTKSSQPVAAVDDTIVSQPSETAPTFGESCLSAEIQRLRIANGSGTSSATPSESGDSTDDASHDLPPCGNARPNFPSKQSPTMTATEAIIPEARSIALSSAQDVNPLAGDDSLRLWITQAYREKGFLGPSFVGWKPFARLLNQEKPDRYQEIMATLSQTCVQSRTTEMQKKIKAAKVARDAKLKHPDFGESIPRLPKISSTLTLEQLRTVSTPQSPASATPSGSSTCNDDASYDQPVSEIARPDFSKHSSLLTKSKNSGQASGDPSGIERGIEQAPLLSGTIIDRHWQKLLPQYGLLGGLAGKDPSLPQSLIYSNTNVPFSAFICGVQGSGKSHTTATLIENAVIRSERIGRLQNPVSTLVFSYGQWSSGGAGFSISEAAYLAASDPTHPGHRAKKVTVLVSPSNPAIKKLYQRLPNVEVIPFKLKAKSLPITALYTLMAIDDKATMPLYMSKVEAILRAIASNSEDGSLDYDLFKKRLKRETFDATQTNMLAMRLNLLEPYLDMTGNAPEPAFRPGEITIMDLSDAFITPSTVCVLFKLGLEDFLQSSAPAKMVVLDEAHKYMIDVPGSRLLTDFLKDTVRLQRHEGARVIISTQEPTISTDLIALCSVTVIHRFTSPTWYAALKKHINAMDDDGAIMEQIEGLETGEALVYAPTAALGEKDDGSLIKAPGQLLKLNIRARVILDGGESIMAV